MSSFSSGGGGGGYGSGGSSMRSSPNQNLLVPVSIDIDPNIQTVRTQEKDQIKTLNNRFASFIDKVRFLEQQNKMLETKWSLLQEQTTTRSNIDAMFEAYIANLRRQLDGLGNEKVKLEGRAEEHAGPDTRMKSTKRASVENDFVLLKKDVDVAYMNKIELEAKVDALQDEDQLPQGRLRACVTLQRQIKDNIGHVEMDTAANLDMDSIVAGSVRSTRPHRQPQPRKRELVIAEEAEERGELAVTDAKNPHQDLEEALQRAKHDMAAGKLLEGEESRWDRSSENQLSVVRCGKVVKQNSIWGLLHKALQ
ncbi:hypothetical protein CRUP_000071, partial [Coryphaenoides rupestris]